MAQEQYERLNTIVAMHNDSVPHDVISRRFGLTFDEIKRAIKDAGRMRVAPVVSWATRQVKSPKPIYAQNRDWLIL